MRGLIALSLAAYAVAAPTVSHGTIHGDAAPILSSSNAEVVPNSYLIKFKNHVSETSAQHHQSWIQQIHTSNEQERMELRKRGQIPFADDVFRGLKHTYQIGEHFMGYSGHFDESVIEQVRRHPDVEYIERDSVVHTMSHKESKCDGETEKMSPWGLARVSHRDALSFGTFNKYLYAAEGGEGVDVYVIDTGTNVDHVDFEGRARWGKTIPANDEDIDGNGHGTHCSGTIAGKKYGVAKKATVYAVKVLRSNGSGTMADVVAGVEFAAKSHIEQVKAAKNGKRKGFKGSAANMSLGGGKTKALDDVVNAAVAAGIHFAVAAGNDNADACNYSPAAAEKAITVGASGIDDSRAYFSNYGKCTDIFAPGLSILSTWIGNKYATNTISGTSMASPHICGLLAYYLSLQPAGESEYSVAPITPEKMKANMLSIATVGALTDMPDETPNLLAWNGGGCSNYSGIIEAGSYKVEPKSVSNGLAGSVTELEEAILHDFNLGHGVSSFTKKAGKFSKKIHDIIEKEMHEFLEDIAA
ncbi:peptidase S8/S53 domain-containing protein [Phialemonium atrogriseum]|uniref:Peptidase S8/S53 domain-containing protein n=1 Tax=Phialemonium atrogriseum TaxID=1093897 RepID=A0AAJ0FN69_9PEZI|nr:peptidase S8/S53 domain-containing protein [Phialemonium atrogriseum]KAK1768674.1 peptidase S8/S53 domain-containing protein [Phialemonium atrogriseum]